MRIAIIQQYAVFTEYLTLLSFESFHIGLVREMFTPVQSTVNEATRGIRRSIPPPQQWKVADVIPINKVPIVKDLDKDLDNDLRPISLTPTLSKVMERFVWQWIMEDIGSCIDIRQFGSLPGSSTAHALISMIHHWLQSADKSNCVRAFFLDFSKAFDRIEHQVVCKKMMEMKIDITLRRWVQSFLSNRTQSVRLPDAQSSYEKVNGGVPQGTVLGPILFLIMVNDLVKMINQRWKYVDDTTISESLAKHETSNLQSLVDDISNWCCINKMKLNSSNLPVEVHSTPASSWCPQF